MFDERLASAVERFQYRLLFATISGAHLYGFPSPDSDFDLRGVHALPLEKVVGLDKPEETVTIERRWPDLHLDLVTHDVRFYFNLLLSRNGNVLDQIYSPLVVHSSSEHEEIKEIGRRCLTRAHSRHYSGLARSRWKHLTATDPPQIKPLLYLYRSLLSGLHLMRAGVVQSNLGRLLELYPQPGIDNLIQEKITGSERVTIPNSDIAFHERAYTRLQNDLDEAAKASHLPEKAPDEAKSALEDLLLRVRLNRPSA